MRILGFPRLPDWTRWLRTATPIQQRAHLGRRHVYRGGPGKLDSVLSDNLA